MSLKTSAPILHDLYVIPSVWVCVCVAVTPVQQAVGGCWGGRVGAQWTTAGVNVWLSGDKRRGQEEQRHRDGDRKWPRDGSRPRIRDSEAAEKWDTTDQTWDQSVVAGEGWGRATGGDLNERRRGRGRYSDCGDLEKSPVNKSINRKALGWRRRSESESVSSKSDSFF